MIHDCNCCGLFVGLWNYKYTRFERLRLNALAIFERIHSFWHFTQEILISSKYCEKSNKCEISAISCEYLSNKHKTIVNIVHLESENTSNVSIYAVITSIYFKFEINESVNAVYFHSLHNWWKENKKLIKTKHLCAFFFSSKSDLWTICLRFSLVKFNKMRHCMYE